MYKQPKPVSQPSGPAKTMPIAVNRLILLVPGGSVKDMEGKQL